MLGQHIIANSVEMGFFADRGTWRGAAICFVADGFSRLALIRGTIRTQILIFAHERHCGGARGYATLGIRHAGDLVVRRSTSR